MEETIDSKITCDAVDYELIDYIPGIALRHIPRIMQEKDRVVRCYELGFNCLQNVILIIPLVIPHISNYFVK
jgi:hypothetical protein